jgi:hypothetical protein
MLIAEFLEMKEFVNVLTNIMAIHTSDVDQSAFKTVIARETLHALITNVKILVLELVELKLFALFSITFLPAPVLLEQQAMLSNTARLFE